MDGVLDLYVKSADYDFKKDLDNQQIIMWHDFSRQHGFDDFNELLKVHREV